VVVDARLQLETHATSDANGNVTLHLPPVGGVPPHAIWHVDQVTISLSHGSGQCVLSHGPTIASPIDIDSTKLAQSNQTSPGGYDLMAGESITLTFSLLTPNTTTASGILRCRQEQAP
jgi:hypothetical protein